MALVAAKVSQGEVHIVGSRMMADLGLLLVGGVATVQLTLSPQVPGQWVNTALATAREPNPSPDDARSSQTITVVDTRDLRLTDQHRQGSGARPTSIVLRFNKPLDPASAAMPSHYCIIGPGPDGRIGTRDDRRIRIKRIDYDPAGLAVTLRPAARLCLNRTYFISVRGIVDTRGKLLDGAGNGRPGSRYRALFHGYDKVRKLFPPIVRRGAGNPRRLADSRDQPQGGLRSGCCHAGPRRSERRRRRDRPIRVLEDASRLCLSASPPQPRSQRD